MTVTCGSTAYVNIETSLTPSGSGPPLLRIELIMTVLAGFSGGLAGTLWSGLVSASLLSRQPALRGLGWVPDSGMRVLGTATVYGACGAAAGLLFWLGWGLAAFAAVPYLREVILPLRIPEAGSARGMFCPSSPSFYLLRLPRLSPFYLVAFLSLLRFGAPHPAGRLLEVYSLVVLIFHSWWGNYQSRYIAAAVPALLLLAAMAIASAGESLGRLPSPRLRRGGQALLLLIVFWLALKTLWIDWNIALPNAVVYF